MSSNVFFSSSSELATLSNTFLVNGVATDPTSVALTVTSPTNVVTTPTPAKQSTGVYTSDVVCNEAGEWAYEWIGTGTATDTVAGTFTVLETTLGHLYVTVQALKSRLAIDNTDDDYELHGVCFSVSRLIEQWCDRTFWRSTTETRTFVPHDWLQFNLPPFSDVVSVSSLATDSSGDGVFETAWTTADYQLLPVNPQAAPEPRPYTAIRAIGTLNFPIIYPGIVARTDRIQVTGIFGWPSIPWGVRQAALILAADAFKLKDAPFGVAGGDVYVTRIGDTQRAMSFLNPYKRKGVRLG